MIPQLPEKVWRNASKVLVERKRYHRVCNGYSPSERMPFQERL
ncbi:hypothetical protein [Citrobacter phage Tr1]|nr:hypothetical protein [Citrobacter phage Tr1]